MSIPEPWTVILMFAAALAPLVNALLLAIPAVRPLGMRCSPLSAVPALALALLGELGVVFETEWTIRFAFFGLDEIARVFLGFTAVLWLISAWFAHGYLAEDRHRLRFYIFFLLSMAGNFILILAQDIPTFYSGFALMGFASAGLVVHKADAEAVRAGRIYLALAAAGEVLLFVAFGLIAARAGSVLMADVVTAELSRTSVVLLLVGFGIKAGALTLHFWLPLAHPAAPVPASAVLSGAMIKAGLFGWLRFLPLGLVAMPKVGAVLIVAGLLAALLATLAGVTQRNAKAVLAYSSFSQMGIITVGLGVAFIEPSAWPGLLAAILVYALHHGLSKGALFLGVTPAAEARTRSEIWVARIGLLVPALALAGAPFTSGAVAKLALKTKLDYLPAPWPYVVGFLLTLAAMGTTLKMARFLALTWPRASNRKETLHHRVWAPWTLSVISVVIGVWLLPGTVDQLLYLAAPKKLWGSLWPVLAGIYLALLVNGIFRRTRWKTPAGIPAGDMIVPFEKLGRGVLRVFKLRVEPRTEPGKQRVSPAWWRERLLRAEARLGSVPTGLGVFFLVVAALLALFVAG